MRDRAWSRLQPQRREKEGSKKGNTAGVINFVVRRGGGFAADRGSGGKMRTEKSDYGEKQLGFVKGEKREYLTE